MKALPCFEEKKMMKNRKLWTGSLVAAALVLSIPAGIAFAQSPSKTTDSSEAQQGGPGGPGQRQGGGGQGGGQFQGGPGGGQQGMPPMMGGMGGGGGTMVAEGDFLFVLQGGRVIKISQGDLRVLKTVELPRPEPRMDQ